MELINLAEQTHPDTRIAWERARQAAIAVGLVESEYYPVLALVASTGGQRLALPAPKKLVPEGDFQINLQRFALE